MSSKKIILNSIMSLLAQFSTIIAQFVVRTYFIRYIGEELVGLDGTLLSILNILALAEAGLSSAMIIFLVRPLQEQNKEEVNCIINTFRVMYKYIGMGYIILAVLIAPFLQYFISGVQVGNIIYLYYALLTINGAMTYFLSYRKVLLYADQQMYVQKTVDSVCCVIFSILQILAIAETKSYVIYIILKVSQTFFDNLIVYMICGKKYRYLKNQEMDKELFRKVIPDMKNLFVGQVAGYVYGSSDSLIISKMISTIQVAYYNNYFLVVNGLKMLLLSLFNAAVPLLKGLMVEHKNERDKSYHVFLLYTHLSFALVAAIIVPAFVLIDPFIVAWVGAKYVMGKVLFLLMILDLFICVMQNPTGNYIIANGLFSYSKYPDIIGAVTNLVISIFLSTGFGMVGILYGTVISRTIQWMIRGHISFKYCFGLGFRDQIRYWLSNIYKIVVVAAMVLVAEFITAHLAISVFLMEFLIKGLISEVVVVLFTIIFFVKSESQIIIIRWIKST